MTTTKHRPCGGCDDTLTEMNFPEQKVDLWGGKFCKDCVNSDEYCWYCGDPAFTGECVSCSHGAW